MRLLPLLMLFVASSALFTKSPSLKSPVLRGEIHQKEGWDPCWDLEDPDAVFACATGSSGSSGGSTCACDCGVQCDTAIVTATGKTLQRTGCSKGSFFGVSGLKCFYWNADTGKNEERFIKC